jgi:hypothetical protein
LDPDFGGIAVVPNTGLNFAIEQSEPMPDLACLYQSVPNLLGSLGEVQPVSGNTRSWNWVIQELKRCPLDFISSTGTPFIHADLCSKHVYETRAAFGVCTLLALGKEFSQPALFQAINVEATELLRTTSTTLDYDLARLQAMVLYQIIRLLYGNVEQRLVAEQQERLIEVWGLRLLRRADIELGILQPTWETWLLAESIRRTVLAAYMLYAVYSVFRDGICPELPTLSSLPVSSRQNTWESGARFVPYENFTMRYTDFTDSWCASPPSGKLEPFEKMLLVACKGIDEVEALSVLGNQKVET